MQIIFLSNFSYFVESFSLVPYNMLYFPFVEIQNKCYASDSLYNIKT